MEVCLQACDQRPDVLREVLFAPAPAGEAHLMASAGMASSVHPFPGAQQADTVDLRVLGVSESPLVHKARRTLRDVLLGPALAGETHQMAAASMSPCVHQPRGAQQADTVDPRSLGGSESPLVHKAHRPHRSPCVSSSRSFSSRSYSTSSSLSRCSRKCFSPGDCRSDWLFYLLGRWEGQDGSSYLVQPHESWSLTVQTTRPNGVKRTTRGLIRRQAFMVFWGQNYILDKGGLPQFVFWQAKEGFAGRSFFWRRFEGGEEASQLPCLLPRCLSRSRSPLRRQPTAHCGSSARRLALALSRAMSPVRMKLMAHRSRPCTRRPRRCSRSGSPLRRKPFGHRGCCFRRPVRGFTRSKSPVRRKTIVHCGRSVQPTRTGIQAPFFTAQPRGKDRQVEPLIS